MNIVPLTLHAWFELCIIAGTVYWFALYSARHAGMRILLILLGYVVFCFSICTASCNLIMPLLPFITLILVIGIVIRLPRTTSTLIQPARLNTSVEQDTPSWLTSCLRTIFNHPEATTPITLLIEIQKIPENAVYNRIPLTLAWNPTLFTSILYDPQLRTTMVWLTSYGLLKGLSVQWTDEKDATDEIQKAHRQQTALYDAVVCIVDSSSRTCTLIHKGALHSHKNLTETIQYITILTHQTQSQNKEKYHGNWYQKRKHDSDNHTT